MIGYQTVAGQGGRIVEIRPVADCQRRPTRSSVRLRCRIVALLRSGRPMAARDLASGTGASGPDTVRALRDLEADGLAVQRPGGWAFPTPTPTEEGPMRQSMRDELLKLVTEHPGLTAAEYTDMSGIDRSTVSGALCALRDRRGQIESAGRRPEVRWYPRGRAPATRLSDADVTATACPEAIHALYARPEPEVAPRQDDATDELDALIAAARRRLQIARAREATLQDEIEQLETQMDDAVHQVRHLEAAVRHLRCVQTGGEE